MFLYNPIYLYAVVSLGSREPLLSTPLPPPPVYEHLSER
jgi:hypothetical protein